jgi:hypothetical protein
MLVESISLKPSLRSKLELIALIGGFIMILSELWRHYEADKRIQGFSPNGMVDYSFDPVSGIGHG